ncbi:MAG: hypothetical protein ACUVYA_00900 [Planctomycetota bacterium]
MRSLGAIAGRTPLPRRISERVAGLRAAIAKAAFVECFLGLSMWLFFAAGIFTLIARTALPALAPWVFWTWLALPAGAVAALVLSLFRMPSAETILVLSDRLGGAGGLLVAVAETGDPEWARRLPESLSEFPYPRIRANRGAVPALVAILLFVATLFLPQRPPEPVRGHAFAAVVAGALEEEIALAEAVALSPEEKEEIRSALERLREEMSKGVDAASLEAASELSAHVAERVLDRERALKRTEEELGALSFASPRAGQSGKSPGEGAESGPREAERAARQALAKLESAARTLGGRGLELDPSSQELLDRLLRGGGSLSSEEASKLARSLREACRAMRRELGSCKSTMASRCRGRACFGLGEKAGALLGGTETALGTRDGSESGAEAHEEGSPGDGGVTRGPAVAPLTWGKESQPGKFRATQAPSRFVFETGKDLFFETLEAPKASPQESGAAAVRDFGAARGSPYEAARMGPRKLKAVRRYFGGSAQ